MGEVPNRYNDEIRNFQADVQARNEKDAQWLSKLAVLGTGLQVFGKATGRNYFADIMNLAGQGSRYFSRIGKVADPEFTAETADLLYRKLGIHKDSGGEAFIQGFGGARVGDLDRVQDLAALMRLQTTAGFETNTKEIYELAKKDFQNLPRKRGGGTPSVFHHDIEPLTFGELIEHNHEFIENSVGLQFKFLKTGGNQKALSIGIVEDALESNLIYTNTIVDANLFVSRGSGKIVDLRMSKANFAIKQISEAIDIAGVGKALASFLGSGRRFSQITPDKGKADKFLIGTDVYTSAGKAGPIKTATNQTLGSVSDKRFVPSVLREHHDAGTIKNLHSAAPLKDSLVGQIQEATGVGPRFADKRSVGLPFVQAMLRNIKGIATGDAKFYAKDYVNASDTVKTRALSAMFPEEATTTVADLGTKGKFHGQGILKDTQKLTWWDKVKAYSGTSKDLIIVDKAAESAQEITSKHVYVNFGAKGVKPLENTTGMRAKTKGATGVDRMGNQTFHERVPNYATSAAAGDKIKDFGNYMSMRLNALASQSTGMGFRPTGNFKANVARLAAIPATLMVGKEVASYVNYEIGELTGTRPTDLIADAYTKARVLQQKIREGTGIQQAAAYSESSLFPGLSTGLMGTLASMAVGLKTLAMTGSPGKALAAAGALYGAAGGPDVAQTSDSLSREYSGEDKVAIRKARWWALGYQPFKGGEIDHFAPSWYRKLKDQPRDKNIYGSEGDYFQNVSLLPTPRNLFGLKKILDPYWLEKKNYYTRPYSQTGKMFDGVPIVGPVLSDTLGELIKPSKKMHPAQQERLVANANIREKGVPSDVASRMGIPGIPNALIDVNRPDVLADRVEKWSNVALEPTGIFKFVLGFFGVKLDENYKLADASNMDSMGRSFYDMNLGGLGGQCFVAGTKVQTVDGYKAIETITPNHIVLSQDGAYKSVKAMHSMGTASDLVKIKIRTIGEELTVTSKHHIPVLRRAKGDIKKTATVDMDAKDILPKDYLAIPIPQDHWGIPEIDLAPLSGERHYSESYVYVRAGQDFINAYELIESNTDITRKELRDLGISDKDCKEALHSFRNLSVGRFDRHALLDEELSWLLGWFCAEGSVEKKGRVSFALSASEVHIASKLGEIAIRRFGANKFEVKQICDGGIVMRVSSVALSILCDSLCGHGAHNKYIPPQILHGDINNARQFLSALLQGDGWCNGEKSGFTSVSKELVQQTQLLASRFGAIGNCVLDYKEKANGNYPQGTPRKNLVRNNLNWHIIETKIINIIYNDLDEPLPAARSCGKSFICNNHIFVQVKEVILFDSKKEVFDLEIEDLHYYTANNVLVHNTEFIRRFFMSDYSTPGKINQQINPIANAMPRWLPGSLGEEESDRGYFTDFTRGDAYTKISGGEYRLPGAGYEAVNRLHSGVSGVYDEVDKFMILADVAPNSTAFFKAQATVQNVEMTDYWRTKVEQATTQRDQKLDVFGFSSQDIVAKANLNPISQVIRSGWDTGYSALTEVPMLGSKLFPTRDPLQHYVKNKVEGDSYANWDNPYETIVRPAILDVAGTNPIGGAAKGAMLGTLIAAPFAKWLNPIAFTSRSMGVNAAVFGTAGGVASTTRMAFTGDLSGGFTPFHVDDEREVNEYFDNLKYVKYSGLASIALNNGDTDHSEALTQVARRTNVFGLASLQSSGDPAAYRRSLSKTDKAYFDAFSSATSGRSDIMSYVPSHMRQALKATYEGPSGNVISADESAYASASEYFEDHTIPDDDSAVWHPSVPISAVKLKSVANGINGVSDSAHRFGFFPSQVRETNSRFPYVQPFESTDQVSFKNTAIGIADLFGEYIPFGNIKGLNLGIGPSMQLTNNEVYDSRREDVFSFFNTQYR